MPLSTVARFEIEHTRFLGPEGELLGSPPPLADDTDALRTAYRGMVRARAFDQKAVALQRTGRLGTYPSSLGEEAVGVAAGLALDDDDVLVPYYRHHAAHLLRGVSPRELLLYWGGDERGADTAAARRDFPPCVPISTQVPHAVGAAYAMQLRGEPRVALCMVGDGGTSKGDFLEALNAAGVWSVPVVFLVDNNQWAISVPRSLQSRAATLAQKAIAAGIPGEQVDGNDYLAVRTRLDEAIDHAREGSGPVLIEAVTYRRGDHTTADDASRYRRDEEVTEQERLDPVERLRCYLVGIGAWTDRDEQETADAAAEEMERESQAYLDTPPQPPASMFDHLYAELPAAYARQRRMLEGGEGDA